MKLILPIKERDNMDYNDLTNEQEDILIRDNVRETVYTCKYCGQSYDMGGAIEHSEYCIANYNTNKNCITCNNYEVHKFESGGKIENDYKTNFVAASVKSNNNKFYCHFKKEYLMNEDYDIKHDRTDCYIAPKDDVIYK